MRDYKILYFSKSSAIFTIRNMKIRILKNILLEVTKARLNEVWDKQYHKWEELNIESINHNKDNTSATLITYDGDIISDLPIDAYEVIKFS